ncbi:MAG: Two component, sigma54 specific, transcriptional regulator, Fis family [Candidatus Dependentiae bacterium]|nr:Two component, sigma54 specific, transcriptional regulator, Fis family [Candidatus Dependentiae bacterium]
MSVLEYIKEAMTDMSKQQPLTDLLKNTVRRMVRSLGQFESGNIYSLLINQVEKNLIEIVLEEQRYNHYHTARVLGIGRSTLYRKMESLKIDPRPVYRRMEKTEDANLRKSFPLREQSR